ncbi:DUF4249 domain-containing protein [Dyadobacter subterraneus]|uniref:DUF4249 domain-containing protein n=1 Tax=Dyadobacter subterraneus TaxID=2773304 RepID=A0ABR9W9Q7_9BACT|nr:DUF4249 domain-containing protein [Dyadobacter subterraneus]MBE9462208.1 DUF4249 domain-containing protein [Dyadobacter subterraneus]
MNRYQKLFFILLVVFFIHGCIKQFSPPGIDTLEQNLVVDGFLNTGADTSIIQLSRTQNLSQTEEPVKETGAALSVEDESGTTFSFKETGAGKYILPPYGFDQGKKYRLRIKTAAGKEYLSEYVAVIKTPAIDSVSYKIEPVRNAVVFYANTHDPKNQTHFYRWSFEETWEYHATYASALEVIAGKVVLREKDINKCWQTFKSRNILLGSTIKQSSDIISEVPINIVPISTNKLYIKYSILLKQYALSSEAFEYWTTLAKTTELTGGLFDPTPFLLTGNIKSTINPSELVFGYFSAGTEEKKRILITPGLGSFPRCAKTDTIPIECRSLDELCALRTEQLLLTYHGKRSDSVTVASAECTDCRLRGGTTLKPAFMN